MNPNFLVHKSMARFEERKKVVVLLNPVKFKCTIIIVKVSEASPKFPIKSCLTFWKSTCSIQSNLNVLHGGWAKQAQNLQKVLVLPYQILMYFKAGKQSKQKKLNVL